MHDNRAAGRGRPGEVGVLRDGVRAILAGESLEPFAAPRVEVVVAISDRGHGNGGSKQLVSPSSLVNPLKTSNRMDGKGWYAPQRFKKVHVLPFAFDLTKEVRYLVGESCGWSVEPGKASIGSISGWATIELGLTDTPDGPRLARIAASYVDPG